MTQVILIHGGTTFANYDEYLDFLRTRSVSLENFIHAPSWQESLQKTLGADYQVLRPSMPNKTNAQYSEWKLWFDRIAEVATDDCILIGHSLGGIFLAKYLSENTFPRRIKATIFIAAPYDDESTEDLTDFKISGVSELFTKQVGKVVFYNGSDDPVVPLHEMEKYRKALPAATFTVLPAPDHFARETFPELTQLLKNL